MPEGLADVFHSVKVIEKAFQPFIIFLAAQNLASICFGVRAAGSKLRQPKLTDVVKAEIAKELCILRHPFHMPSVHGFIPPCGPLEGGPPVNDLKIQDALQSFAVCHKYVPIAAVFGGLSQFNGP